MTKEVLSPYGFSVAEEKMLQGSLLDMWRLYQHLSSDPERLSDLTCFDTLSARDGMLFPDFFNAVHNFLSPDNNFHPTRRGTIPRSEEVCGFKDELDQTFRTMQSKWDSYGPFFERHPELKYLRELSLRAGEVREFSEKIPFLRRVDTHGLWSIVEYHRLRGDLDFYVALDKAICRKPEVGTLFEEDASCPGDFLVYLLPYGKDADQIKEYLPLLKHGDLIGFGEVALAQVNGERFVAVSSIQTDLLRRDYVVEEFSGTSFSFSKIVKNDDGRYTIPSGVRKQYLAKGDWAHRLVGVVENAVREISEQFPVSGVIIPTLSTYGTSDFVWVSRSEYASRLYSSFPQERGYQLSKLRPCFPLTEQWEGIMLGGSGEWWAKPIDEIRAS